MAIGMMVALIMALDGDLPIVQVDRDNILITQSCTLLFSVTPLADTDGNGVVHIAADNLTVNCADPMMSGATAGHEPDTFKGIGIRITGKHVTISNANIAGYKVGILADHADGLTIRHCDISGNFRQRLKSTPSAEDGGDWLWPHANDKQEWRTNYGAAICVEQARNVTIREVKVRNGQNGIILDRVTDSRVFDCDCSFLSGWGLALWRSSGNVIDHNAFDFCVRGYSHGVYNRGQDSAGILMFEQCNSNSFIDNSVTHGGDGLFAFGGKEAIGEADPHEDREWYKQRGCNENVFLGNDFSFAAAHGLELTFSFNNSIIGNRFLSNGICGIWGGYSQGTVILDNDFSDNGSMAYGLERGGINIEHGRNNKIRHNRFSRNACGVHLWWDADEGLMKSPWAAANDPSSSGNIITNNQFTGDAIGVQLRSCGGTVVDLSQFQDVEEASRVVLDEESRKNLTRVRDGYTQPATRPSLSANGTMVQVGARQELEGRDKIIMGEWGPYDWQTPLLRCVEREGGRHIWRLLGSTAKFNERGVAVEGEARETVEPDRIVIEAENPNSITPYVLNVDVGRTRLNAKGFLFDTVWHCTSFPSSVDPRQEPEAWRAKGEVDGVPYVVSSLDLPFGSGGPSQLPLGDAVKAANLPVDNFGTIAVTTVRFPAGKWRIRTLSDDGIRVWLDDALVIDDWTHHAPAPHDHEWEPTAGRDVKIRVEHFELDGHATLSLEVEPVTP